MVIFGSLEFPKSPHQLDKLLTIEGWAVAPGKKISVEIVIDGKRIDLIKTGVPRYDIFKKYNKEEFYESGFFFHLVRKKLVECGINTKKESCTLDVNVISDTEEKNIGRAVLKINQNISKIPKPETFYNEFSVGQEFFLYLKSLGEIKPNHRILDVGCGIGRIAMPFTKYLSDGEYFGFDIVPFAIERCQTHITSRYPNFHFILANVKNNYYNKNSSVEAESYRFPYESDFFDVIFLQSVFTHLLPNEVVNYLSEIRRVLKKGGRCLITYYLINNESLEAIRQNNVLIPAYRFENNLGEYFTAFLDKPEASIAYNENFIKKIHKETKLEIKKIVYGKWCRKNIPKNYHSDIVLSIKK